MRLTNADNRGGQPIIDGVFRGCNHGKVRFPCFEDPVRWSSVGRKISSKSRCWGAKLNSLRASISPALLQQIKKTNLAPSEMESCLFKRSAQTYPPGTGASAVSFPFSDCDAHRNYAKRYKLFYHLPLEIERERIRVRVRQLGEGLVIQVEHGVEEEETHVTVRTTLLPPDIDISNIVPILRCVQWNEERRMILEIELPKVDIKLTN